MDLPRQSQSGPDVRDTVAGGVGIGGVQQQFAAGAERSDSRRNLHAVADHDVQWTNADAAEFPNADCELERGGDVEDVGLEGVAADEEADVVEFVAAAIVADAVEFVVEDVLLRG